MLGPGSYSDRFSAEGKLLSTITQPYAALPYIDGALNFTSETQPTTGRSGNQGFEGLTASADGRMLWALLQSATVQDGGRDDSASRDSSRFDWLVADQLSFHNRVPWQRDPTPAFLAGTFRRRRPF